MHSFPNTNTIKTKIVATIGPKTESKEAFRTLLKAGISVARTNMSHDDHAGHTARIKTIRAVSKQEKIPVAILQDLSGPKIRIGDFETATVELVAGEQLILTGKKCIGTKDKVYFNYPYIKKDIKPGMVLMLDDGKKRVKVDRVEGTDIYTTIEIGGITKGRRGVNIPGAYLSIKALTEKDREDLKLGLELGVDFIALSFVRTAKDVQELRTLITEAGGTQMIVSKIETEEAIENIDAIIGASDAIMVARGDLAVEVGPAKVPGLQKMIIRKCNELGKPVIVATQMLESMINAPVPTRAEVSDVANAIFDGADAVMLSEETTLGSFAVEAVRVMQNVAQEAEGTISTHRRHKVHNNDIVDSVSSSVVHNAEDVAAKAIVALTETGSTPRMVARYRSQQSVIAFTPHEHVLRQLLLSYGCYPFITKPFSGSNQLALTLGKKLIELGILAPKDRFVVTAGVPFGVPGSTNIMMVLTA